MSFSPPQTCVTVLADDDVVVHGNAEWGGDLDDRFRHLDVAPATASDRRSILILKSSLDYLVTRVY
jgi:hypothetical protein